MNKILCTELDIIKDKMTVEEIAEAEIKLKPFRKLVEILSKCRSDKIEIPIEFPKELNFKARDPIVTIKIEKWKEWNSNLIVGVTKQIAEAEEKLAQAKINLEKKQKIK